MFYQIPPVGNRVCLDSQPGDEAALQAVTGSSVVRYYQSGTAALAASIMAAIRRGGVTNPEVLLPAYGCPDLVSAAVHAGARPVLVDLEADRPWMDLEQVATGITQQTVAVIAAILLTVLLGTVGLSRLPIQMIPDAQEPFIQVTTGWRSAAPEEVESEIIEPQEDVLRGVDRRGQPG